MRSPCQQGIMYWERHIFSIRIALLIHFIKTGKEEHSHTPPLSKLNVTTQYLHSYNQESIPDRLRRWDFCLPDYVFLQSDDGGCFHSINTIPPHTQFPYIPLSEKTYASAKPPPRSQSGMRSSPLRNPPVPSGYSTGSDPSSGNFLFSDP